MHQLTTLEIEMSNQELDKKIRKVWDADRYVMKATKKQAYESFVSDVKALIRSELDAVMPERADSWYHGDMLTQGSVEQLAFNAAIDEFEQNRKARGL